MTIHDNNLRNVAETGNVTDSPIEWVRLDKSVSFAWNIVCFWWLNKNFINIIEPNFTAEATQQLYRVNIIITRKYNLKDVEAIQRFLWAQAHDDVK